MGSNSCGQLGINDPYSQQKYSPVLIESMLDKNPFQVKCGDFHSLVVCDNGETYAWGSNKYGQCGSGNNGTGNQSILFSPKLVSFDSYFNP